MTEVFLKLFGQKIVGDCEVNLGSSKREGPLALAANRTPHDKSVAQRSGHVEDMHWQINYVCTKDNNVTNDSTNAEKKIASALLCAANPG